ncbi:hypothetical protein Ocin01_15197 [Orchesella cincta]|uniref:Uncharacterized protein n=1 Tax=Orchesella cincta TaxID=48709 RepID=A0A1D2MEP2_ORCCI|nr:hypothetical protein Ocin01_15197 [Orchesella cincta]
MQKQKETLPQPQVRQVQRDVKVEVDAETNSRISMDLYDDDDDSVPFEDYDNFESLSTEPEEERKKDDTTTTGGRIGGADEGGEDEIFIKEEPLDEDEQETDVHLKYQPDEDEEGNNDEEGSYYEPSSCSELESDCDSYSKLEEDTSPVQKKWCKILSLTEKFLTQGLPLLDMFQVIFN